MLEPSANAKVTIWCAGPSAGIAQRAQQLSQHLGLPILRDDAILASALLLAVTEDGLELREPILARRAGFSPDLTALIRRLRAHPPTRSQPLLRALGKGTPAVFDATAGWGHDAVLLASIGCKVIAAERSPIVAAMLEDAMHRATLADESAARVLKRITIVQGDARSLLRSPAAVPDVVYLDPMYPPKKKSSARSRKSVDLLRMLVGEDADADELLTAAMRSGARRVIVKRADDSTQLHGSPDITFAGTTVRYDVFLPLTRSNEP